MGNNATLVYAEEWATKLQERLTEATVWKEICNVEYTNSRVLHNPYLTDAVVSTLTRGTAYTFKPIVETDDTVTINSTSICPQFIDRADLAQSTFLKQMDMADAQGVLLDEAIGTAVFADHASFTNIGVGDITAGSVADTTQITVSATNIDDIIRHVKRIIRVAKGEALMNRNGVFIVWRPSDLEILESFMQANGFVSADKALGEGATQGMTYMGVTHYSSNLLAANHVFAGVKKVYHLGIVKDTYGQIVITQDPNLVSGIGIISRVDYQGKAWNKTTPVLFDINVV